MVSLLEAREDDPILEPSAGKGVFLDSLVSAGFTDLTAVEIDHSLCRRSDHKIEHCSFLTWDKPKCFAAVVGNPPYVRWKNMNESQKQEMRNHRQWGRLFNSLSDYLTVFIASSVEALRLGGELVFITPSFWLGTKHSGNLREWLLRQGAFTSIVDFGESSVFPGVSSHIIIFRFQKGLAQAHTEIEKWRYHGKRHLPDHLDLSDASQFGFELIPSFTAQKQWSLSSKSVQKSADRLGAFCAYGTEPRLLDHVRIANGMVSGLDKAFQIPDDAAGNLNERELENTYTVLKAKDMAQLQPRRYRKYINIKSEVSQSQFREYYPYFYSLLTPFRDALEKRYSYGRDLPFWDWAFKRSESFFLSPVGKIFVPSKERLTSRKFIRFSLVKGGIIATQDVTAIAPLDTTRESLEYIYGFLILPAVTDWVRAYGHLKGGVAEFSKRPLGDIPFRPIDWNSTFEVQLHDKIKNRVLESVNTSDFIGLREDLTVLFAELDRRVRLL